MFKVREGNKEKQLLPQTKSNIAQSCHKYQMVKLDLASSSVHTFDTNQDSKGCSSSNNHWRLV